MFSDTILILSCVRDAKDGEIMSQFVKAATTDQIQPGKCIGVKVEGVFHRYLQR